MTLNWKLIWMNLALVLFFLSIPILSSPDFDYSLAVFRVNPFLRNFAGYVLIVLFFYFNFYFLIPRLYDHKKFVMYTLSVLGVFVFIVCIQHFGFGRPPGVFDRFHPEDFRNMPHRPGPMPWFFNISTVIPFLLVLLFSLALSFNRKTKQIELDKYRVELQNLKYQLQPHFLFNSLNNIYSISIIEPQKTPEYILKLSEILRHLLLTDTSETVPVNDDIKFCRQYIDLQFLRFENHENWNIEIENPASSQHISPFLLIPFIENVFKYGTHPDKPSPISVIIKLEKDRLNLFTKNTKKATNKSNLLATDKIGLKKTRERLDLIYPGQYSLDIRDNKTDFEVNLTIQLHG